MKSSYGIVRRETSTLSSDGHSWLRVLAWFPDPTYTRHGIVQLVHGMSEHIGRYDHFARFLAGLGYVVFGHDHIGHGKSTSSTRDLGCLPLSNGKEVLIEDVLCVRKAFLAESRPYLFKSVRMNKKSEHETDGQAFDPKAKAPEAESLAAEDTSSELPLFLFGHSMGSYIARIVAARYPQDLAGVVLCGAGNQPALLAKLGNVLSKGVAALKGETYRSSFLYSLVSGSFVSAIDNPRTEFDWLSTDPAVVDAFCADPLSGARFSAGGYVTLTDLVAEAVSKHTAETTPSDLPVLFIAGEDDPVGSSGKGVRKAALHYQSAGMNDVEVILYPGMRHEILNEPGKMTVYSDVEAWLTQHAILWEIARQDTQGLSSSEERSEGSEERPESSAS